MEQITRRTVLNIVNIFYLFLANLDFKFETSKSHDFLRFIQLVRLQAVQLGQDHVCVTHILRN